MKTMYSQTTFYFTTSFGLDREPVNVSLKYSHRPNGSLCRLGKAISCPHRLVRLLPRAIGTGAKMAIQGDGEMPVDDGEVIEVAARRNVNAVEWLTRRSSAPEPEVIHRGIARMPNDGMLRSSDRCLSAMKPIICDM
jgi:hypothetical protein